MAWISEGLEMVVPQPDMKSNQAPAESPAEVEVNHTPLAAPGIYSLNICLSFLLRCVRKQLLQVRTWEYSHTGQTWPGRSVTLMFSRLQLQNLRWWWWRCSQTKRTTETTSLSHPGLCWF